MSLRKKIESGVNKAFDAVGDLKEQVTLRSKSSSEYDFSSGETKHIYEETSVDAIVIYVKQKTGSNEIQSPRKEVLIKETDLENPSVYDEVIIDDTTHTIISFTKETGLITLLVTEG